MDPSARHATVTILVLAAGMSACGERSRLPESADVGPQPTLGEPRTSPIPTVNVAPAEPWPAGTQPTPAPGLQLSAFAQGLDHPRWLHVLPNGDVLVAETNAPPRPEDGQGVKGWVMKQLMGRAGAASPSANRITLLRDADGDGRAEVRSAFLQGLHSPFGMALIADRFYVAHTDSVWEYPYAAGATRIESAGRKITDLPGGPINHHWTKSLIASPDGRRLYATVGSNSNVAENGITAEEGRAAIWEIDPANGSKRLFATGLRNPNGMAWTGSATEPVLWTVVNERDELGSDLVPDYLTSVRDGGFYGWPYSWYGTHVDTRAQPPRSGLVSRAIVPDYALGSHVAPLGLAASIGSPLPALLGAGASAGTGTSGGNASSTSSSGVIGASGASAPTAASAPGTAPGTAVGPASAAVAASAGASAPASAAAAASGAASGTAAAPGLAGAAPAGPVQGMFVGLHGSWNRRPHSGYKVIYVPFADGRPHGMPLNVLTGFLGPEGEARGRPVGVALDPRGALLVADDVGNTVWRVAPR